MIKLSNIVKTSGKELHNHESIIEVYGKLCELVFNKCEKFDKKLTYKKPNSSEYHDITEEILKEFLLSKDFYNYAFEFEGVDIDASTSNDLKHILACKGNTLIKNIDISETLQNKKIKENFDEFCKSHGESKFSPKLKKQFIQKYYPDYEKIIYANIFDYDFLQKKIGKNKMRDIILSSIDISVCPYCNRNYINCFEDENKKRSSADADHFYIKKENPYYALCLYNLIPSCNVCNSRTKGVKDMTVASHVYPYDNSFENKTYFEIKNLPQCITDKDTPEIGFDNQIDEKVSRNIRDFKIEELYQIHSSYCQDLIDKAVIYNESYNEELNEILHTPIKSLVFGEELTEDDFRHISLAKLKRDLLIQLGIYSKPK